MGWARIEKETRDTSCEEFNDNHNLSEQSNFVVIKV